MRTAPVLLLLVLAACNGDRLESADAAASLPETDSQFWAVAADASDDELREGIDQGLLTGGKGPDNWRFVVIRAADRHDERLPDSAFHVVVGAGVRLPKGSLVLLRNWGTSGTVDGTNEQLETYGIAVAVERGAEQPFDPAVVQATTRFCRMIGPRIGLHPDCVVSMGEVPFTRDDKADAAERALAAAVRGGLTAPAAQGKLTVVSGDKRIPITIDRRDTNTGRMVGMMMRKGFDDPNRGMLFIYPHRHQQRFYMRNCFFPIDLAYIKFGRIEQIETMKPQAGVPTEDLPRYESTTAVRFVLEMEGGWFARNGVAVGDRVEGLPPS
ncbi:MAG: DUF192 domain-containing protein [Planctomycetota bacterium]|jgi:uncharacterized membrane protein (UPF0127 family)